MSTYLSLAFLLFLRDFSPNLSQNTRPATFAASVTCTMDKKLSRPVFSMPLNLGIAGLPPIVVTVLPWLEVAPFPKLLVNSLVSVVACPKVKVEVCIFTIRK